MDDILASNITAAGVDAGLALLAKNFYYLKDYLGSVTSITDSAGNIVQKYDYRSFGKILSIRNSSGADISASPIVKRLSHLLGENGIRKLEYFIIVQGTSMTVFYTLIGLSNNACDPEHGGLYRSDFCGISRGINGN